MKKYHLIILLLSFYLFADNQHQSSYDYITGDDGVIRMNINVIGNVKSPGNFIVKDNTDILSAISLAGGYMEGSDLRNIIIYKKNGIKKEINLDEFLNFDKSVATIIKLEPNDTIFINQKLISRFLFSSNFLPIVLSILNVAISLENSNSSD